MERMAVLSGGGNANGNKSQSHPPFPYSCSYNGNWLKEDFSSAEESVSSPSSSASSAPGFIEHRVSKLDTLAGVAIKYGVEVADIKKMNGLVSDLQMFALKSIQIPLPGRHPPSVCPPHDMSTSRQSSSEETPLSRLHIDFLDSLQSTKLASSNRKASLPTSQNYHKPKSMESRRLFEEFEAAAGQPENLHRKSKSFINSILEEMNGGPENETLVRRRQKSETDFTLYAGQDSNTKSKGKGLAQRSTAVSRNTFPADSDGGSLAIPQVDGVIADGFSGVRKSSSTSSLQEQETGLLRSASKWSLKPDLQALGKPIFDGLPKPLTGRKSKTALD